MSRKKKETRGRKKKRRSFLETRIGFLLAHKTPLEYRLLIEASGVSAPNADLIEAISYVSLDPFFKTTTFRWALIEYRKSGLYPPYFVKPNVDKELRYIKYRRERPKMKEFKIKEAK